VPLHAGLRAERELRHRRDLRPLRHQHLQEQHRERGVRAVHAALQRARGLAQREHVPL
jgi:hypothetical protein